MKRTVNIYNGLGSSQVSYKLLLSSLEHNLCLFKYSVTSISPEQIKEGSWKKNCAAIVFGGGFDVGFLHSLGHTGMKMVHDFVTEGGTYMGFCAGGYFGCDYIEFDKGGPLEVCGERDLKFFPGKCIGPIVSGFQYDTHKGLKAIPIKFHANGGQHKEFCFRSYVNGGGFFQPYDSFRNFAHVQNVQVLASYINFPNMPAAIVKCAVGVDGGMAILTGTHPEFCVFEMDCSDPDLQKHQKDLEADDGVREKCFRHLLQAANLEVNKKYSDRTVTSKI